jgi:hypothetical protein
MRPFGTYLRGWPCKEWDWKPPKLEVPGCNDFLDRCRKLVCKPLRWMQLEESGGEGGIELPFVWAGVAVVCGRYVACFERAFVICLYLQVECV